MIRISICVMEGTLLQCHGWASDCAYPVRSSHSTGSKQLLMLGPSLTLPRLNTVANRKVCPAFMLGSLLTLDGRCHADADA
jgi:hypothetical protein